MPYFRRAFLVVVLIGSAACSRPEKVQQSPLPDLGKLSAGLAPALRTKLTASYEQVRLHPTDADANGRLGMLFQAWGQPATAAYFYDRAHSIDPVQFKWLYYLGTVQAASGKNPEATATFQRAVQANSGYLPARMKLAEALLSLGKVSESAALYETLVRDEPQFAPGHYWLGRARSAEGDTNRAIEQYEKACVLAPTYGAGHYALALSYQKQGRTLEAREQMALYQSNQLVEPSTGDTLLEAVSVLDDSALRHLKRGVNLGVEGQLEAAVQEHLKALDRDRKLAQAHANLISLYGRLKQPKEAETHYHAAVALDPNLAECYYDFGVLLFEQKDNRRASQAFRKALAIDAYNPEAHNNLGYLLEQDGKWQEAIQQYRAALEEKPNYRLARFHLGRLLLANGRTQEAIRQFAQILHPEDESTPGFTYALAGAYARSGDFENAARYGREAEQLAASHGQTQLEETIKEDLRKLRSGARR